MDNCKGAIGGSRPATAWEREQREKQACAVEYGAQTQPPKDYGDTCGQAEIGRVRAPTMREQAEKQVGYHREQADRNDQALAFFREHPAFDEFIRLVRSGIIQF